MILEFLPEASAELYAAAEYYEQKEEGLGWRFRNEVLQVCQLIVQQPVLWRERTGGYRRVNCPVFPYYVAYFIRVTALLLQQLHTDISGRNTGKTDSIDTEQCRCTQLRERAVVSIRTSLARLA
jgi:hypothetical protein